MTILFDDTETTGKGNFKAPVDAPGQPRLVQLGAILADETGRIISEINLIVKPDGFEIPVEASDIHGITTEMAMKYGLKLSTVLGMYNAFVDRADLIVAHNFNYDDRVLRGEYLRAGLPDIAKKLSERKSFCTMKATTDLLQLPGMYGDYKWPKLEESYKFLFNEMFEGAHDAMADVRACKRIYYKLHEGKS